MSDDGSWEWLQENNISPHRFDNGGIYDLFSLQSEILRTVHRIKPDWVIYNGCDLFPITLPPLAEYLELLEKNNYSGAQIDFINFSTPVSNPMMILLQLIFIMRHQHIQQNLVTSLKSIRN
tara:strand:- start:3534 stop:3896 length:363 start_codon:yes stop_codon:yes gene_type:complete